MFIVVIAYNRMRQAIDCIRSVGADVASSEFRHRLVVIDNCSRDGTANCLKLYKARHKDVPMTLCLGQKNVGKAIAVNEMVNEYGAGEDIICSFDGDLTVMEPRFFDRMESIYRIAQEKYGFAILCASQKGHCVHNMRLLRGGVLTPQGEILYNPKGGSGVAGGCLTVSAKIFASVGGYRTNLGIYGGNDGFFIQDVLAKHPGKKVGMVSFLNVYHPPEEDGGYESYKINAVNKIRATGFGTTKEYYDENNHGGV